MEQRPTKLPIYISMEAYHIAFDKYVAEGKTEKEADTLCGVDQWNHDIRMEIAAKQILRWTTGPQVLDCSIVLTEEAFVEECKSNRMHWETIRQCRNGTDILYPYYVKEVLARIEQQRRTDFLLLAEAEDVHVRNKLEGRKNAHIEGTGAIYETVLDDDDCGTRDTGYHAGRIVTR